MTHYVRDVMSRSPATVQTRDSLQTARQRMIAHQCRGLPVMDEHGQLCGIITDRDLRLAANSPLIMRERWQDEMLFEHTEVAACMTPEPYSTTPDTPLHEAITVLLAHKISGMPVIENQTLVGVLTITDLLHTLQDMLSATGDHSSSV